MRRPRPLITAVAIIAIMGTSAMALARSSVAQGEPASALPAPATVTLYHHTLEWQTLPHHFVTAWVTHTEGIRSDGRGGLVGQTGNGYGRADANGHAAVRLYGGGRRVCGTVRGARQCRCAAARRPARGSRRARAC